MGSDCEYLGILAKVINSSYEQVDCMVHTLIIEVKKIVVSVNFIKFINQIFAILTIDYQ